MAFGPLSIEDLLDLVDDCVQQLEERSGEIVGENENYLVEVARRFQALGSHFGPMLSERFPHVPDEVLVDKPFHTLVQWPDSPGAHEGAPFSMTGMSSVHPAVGARLDEIMQPHDPWHGRMPTGDEVRGLVNMEYELGHGSASPIFAGGAPMAGPVLGTQVPTSGRVLPGEVEEAGADEEES